MRRDLLPILLVAVMCFLAGFQVALLLVQQGVIVSSTVSK